MQLFSVILDYERSTKGTHVYATAEDAPIRITGFYIPRDALPANPPERIELVATSAE
jgi:hypothetical protein